MRHSSAVSVVFRRMLDAIKVASCRLSCLPVMVTLALGRVPSSSLSLLDSGLLSTLTSAVLAVWSATTRSDFLRGEIDLTVALGWPLWASNQLSIPGSGRVTRPLVPGILSTGMM